MLRGFLLRPRMFLLDGASPAPHPVFFTPRRPNLAQTNNLFCSLLRPCAWLRHREVVTPKLERRSNLKITYVAYAAHITHDAPRAPGQPKRVASGSWHVWSTTQRVDALGWRKTEEKVYDLFLVHNGRVSCFPSTHIVQPLSTFHDADSSFSCPTYLR